MLTILAGVRAVPDGIRRFDASADLASRQYGISPALLEDLLAHGLPVQHQGEALTFDRYDLANISLHMGLSSIQRMAMRSWAKTLQLGDTHGCFAAAVRILPAAPLDGEPPLTELQLFVRRHDVRAAGAIRHLLEEFQQFRFFMLPEACRWNLDFIAKNKICECGGASKLLLQLALSQSLTARQCFGFLISEPYSTGHYWTEFFMDGEWVAFDPVLLGLLHLVTKLPPENWPTYRSNSFALHRLCIIETFDTAGAPELRGCVDTPGIATPLIMKNQNLMVSLPTVFHMVA